VEESAYSQPFKTEIDGRDAQVFLGSVQRWVNAAPAVVASTERTQADAAKTEAPAADRTQAPGAASASASDSKPLTRKEKRRQKQEREEQRRRESKRGFGRRRRQEEAQRAKAEALLKQIPSAPPPFSFIDRSVSEPPIGS
jgi:hypothetical protein